VWVRPASRPPALGGRGQPSSRRRTRQANASIWHQEATSGAAVVGRRACTHMVRFQKIADGGRRWRLSYGLKAGVSRAGRVGCRTTYHSGFMAVCLWHTTDPARCTSTARGREDGDAGAVTKPIDSSRDTHSTKRSEGARRAQTWSVENKQSLAPRTKTLLIAGGPASRASARLPAGARLPR
jgi:hypothetical protein